VLATVGLALLGPGVIPVAAQPGVAVTAVACGDVGGLRDALLGAQTRALTVIELNPERVPGCTYRLTQPYDAGAEMGLPAVSTGAAVVIDGNGSTILRQSSSPFRILFAGFVTDLTIKDLTVEGGSLTGPLGSPNDGAGISSQGVLTVVRSRIVGNAADGVGGGIAAGHLTMVDSSVSGNTAQGDGGGIWFCPDIVTDSLSISGSVISDNHSAARGGGIYLACGFKAALTLARSAVHDNSSSGGGGGIFSDPAGPGTILVTASSVSRNSTLDGSGGGIADGAAQLIALGSTFTGNSAPSTTLGTGGAIDVDSSGAVVLFGGSVTGNAAGVDGGGMYVQPAVTQPTNVFGAFGVAFAANTPDNCAPPGSVSGCSG
jgi:hypothetical protein